MARHPFLLIPAHNEHELLKPQFRYQQGVLTSRPLWLTVNFLNGLTCS